MIREGITEFGDAKVYVKREDSFDTYKMWVLFNEGLVTMDDGTIIVVAPPPEGHSLTDEEVFMSWSGHESLNMSLLDVFGAVAHALGGHGGDLRDAYEKGRLEGENKTLREWNKSITTLQTAKPSRPSSSPPKMWRNDQDTGMYSGTSGSITFSGDITNA